MLGRKIRLFWFFRAIFKERNHRKKWILLEEILAFSNPDNMLTVNRLARLNPLLPKCRLCFCLCLLIKPLPNLLDLLQFYLAYRLREALGHIISSLELSCPADIATIQAGRYGSDAFIHTHRPTSPHIHLPEFTGEV